MMCPAGDLPRGLKGLRLYSNQLFRAGKVVSDFLQVTHANASYFWCKVQMFHVT